MQATDSEELVSNQDSHDSYIDNVAEKVFGDVDYKQLVMQDEIMDKLKCPVQEGCRYSDTAVGQNCAPKVECSGRINPDIKVAGEILASGSRPYLERYYFNSDTPADRSKAMEIMTSLDMSHELQVKSLNKPSHYVHPRELQMQEQRRPVTAGPTYGRKKQAHSCVATERVSLFNPYETSYKKHYPTKPTVSTNATRPETAHYSFTAPRSSNAPTGYTIYSEEFHDKYAPKCQPLRSGSASGNRNHNPHPSREFLIWGYPRKKREPLLSSNSSLTIQSLSKHYKEPLAVQNFTSQDTEMNEDNPKTARNNSRLGKPVISSQDLVQTSQTSAFHQPNIDNEIFDKVIRGKCQSTYQVDYSSVLNGGRSTENSLAGGSYYGVENVPELYDTREKAKYTLDTSARAAYTTPIALPKELSVPKTRFASSQTKREAAYGTLPGVVNPALMHMVSRTSYDRDLNERANNVYGIKKDIRILGRKYTAETLRKALDRCRPEEQENIRRILSELEKIQERQTHPVLARNIACEGNRVATPKWISKWTGPS